MKEVKERLTMLHVYKKATIAQYIPLFLVGERIDKFRFSWWFSLWGWHLPSGPREQHVGCHSIGTRVADPGLDWPDPGLDWPDPGLDWPDPVLD